MLGVSHACRKAGGNNNNVVPTTRRIRFSLARVVPGGTYTLRVALAAAHVQNTGPRERRRRPVLVDGVRRRQRHRAARHPRRAVGPRDPDQGVPAEPRPKRHQHHAAEGL
jgi:hypothetical protein